MHAIGTGNAVGGLGAMDFDDLPYVSMPIPYTAPARLAAMAALHGIAAPAAENAQVLEIGCASGGNIVPLAQRFPRARFTGVDLSERHVADGRRRAAALRLANIEILQADIAAFDIDGRQFDYIICHGVFSWVPAPVREAVLRICAQSLSPSGIAAISFNVLPGWHMRNAVRDICLLHAGTGPPLTRVARVRALLDDLASAVRPAEPYGLLLQGEARRLTRRPASYIIGEFLAPDNVPMHFADVAAMAQRHGLSYLCEGDLPSSLPETAAPGRAAAIRRHAGNDPGAVQQYLDIFLGRTFRRSLFVRSGASGVAITPPRPESLASLHIASELQALSIADEGRDRHATAFKDHRGKTFTVTDAAVGRCLMRLGKTFPATLPVDELISDAAGNDGDVAAVSKVRDALFRLLCSGRASISSQPLAVGRADAERPVAWSLARAEAASGQPWVTGARHTSVLLNPAMKCLLPLLDGSLDRAALLAKLADALARGDIKLHANPATTETSAVAIRPSFEKQLALALDYLERNALLVE